VAIATNLLRRQEIVVRPGAGGRREMTGHSLQPHVYCARTVSRTAAAVWECRLRKTRRRLPRAGPRSASNACP
jgi:hypothetical protein